MAQGRRRSGPGPSRRGGSKQGGGRQGGSGRRGERGPGATGTGGAGAPGEHLVDELKWVHGMIRKDLRVLRTLAGQIGAGAPAEPVRQKIQALKTRSPLWQLRVNCLRYCQFVHAHHGNEDVRLFPALRRSNPALAPVVDRLVADHRRVSDLLDQVQALGDLVGSDDSAETRGRLVRAIDDLGTHLLEHLDYEERSISATLRTWKNWPG